MAKPLTKAAKLNRYAAMLDELPDYLDKLAAETQALLDLRNEAMQYQRILTTCGTFVHKGVGMQVNTKHDGRVCVAMPVDDEEVAAVILKRGAFYELQLLTIDGDEVLTEVRPVQSLEQGVDLAKDWISDHYASNLSSRKDAVREDQETE